MKKLLMLLALMMLLVNCAAAEHVCAVSGMVDMDLNERWDVCECGEKLNITQHVWTTDAWGDKLCSLCGAQQYLWDDGALELCGVDEHGSIVRQITWNADGEVTLNYATVYQYDEQGHVLSAWYYLDDILFSESEFALDSQGYEYEIRSITYETDGSMYVSEYNEQGDAILEEFYFGGELESAISHEYTYDAQGYKTRVRSYSEGALVEETDYVVLQEGDEVNYYMAKMTVWYYDGTRFTCIADERGDIVSDANYDAEGNLICAYTYDYEYDDADQLLRVSTSEGDKLLLVEEYAVDADGWAYVAVETVYEADGTTTVTRYNEFGEVIE